MRTDHEVDEAEVRIRASQQDLGEAVARNNNGSDPHRSMPSKRPTTLERVIIVVGVACLGLIGALGAMVAALAMASNLISGFNPSNWFASASGFDQLGGGTPGSGVRYVVFMVGALVAFGCKAGIDYLRNLSRSPHVPTPIPPGPIPSSDPRIRSGCFGVSMGVMIGILGAVALLVGGLVAIFVSAADDVADTSEAVSSSTVQFRTTSTTIRRSLSEQLTDTTRGRSLSEQLTDTTRGRSLSEQLRDPDATFRRSDKCTVRGVDSYDDIQVRLEVTSPFDAMSETLMITYSLIGADGIRFATATAYPEFVRPREFLTVDDDSLASADGRTTTGMTCQILNIEPF